MHDKYVYKELSYRLIGLTYELFNSVGAGHKEKYYQSGLKELLTHNQIPFKKELFVPLKVKDKTIGRYYYDFLIDNKIVLELKVGPFFRDAEFKQLYSYLVAQQYKLGIIVKFTKAGVRYRRVLNLH